MTHDSMSTCPKCGRSLGLIRAELVTVGALLKHDCGFVLVVTSVTGPLYDWRPATDEDKQGAGQ